ncbi:MAG: hypothetical protein JWM80_2344 [Cyanobacteria bacterium RYN_339]|nr:hypothetical protein [Cyanobacteria bacterium RYN_339]
MSVALLKIVLKGAATGVALAAAVFSPPGQDAYAAWALRHAADGLRYTSVNGPEIGAGTVKLDLPDGSNGVSDENRQRRVYRFARELDLGHAGAARVAFDLTGHPEGLPGRATLETHNKKTFRAVHVREDGQHAGFYQLANHDERYFSVAIYYDETATNPKAMAAVIDHILGSVQD